MHIHFGPKTDDTFNCFFWSLSVKLKFFLWFMSESENNYQRVPTNVEIKKEDFMHVISAALTLLLLFFAIALNICSIAKISFQVTKLPQFRAEHHVTNLNFSSFYT